MNDSVKRKYTPSIEQTINLKINSNNEQNNKKVKN